MKVLAKSAAGLLVGFAVMTAIYFVGDAIASHLFALSRDDLITNNHSVLLERIRALRLSVLGALGVAAIVGAIAGCYTAARLGVHSRAAITLVAALLLLIPSLQMAISNPELLWLLAVAAALVPVCVFAGRRTASWRRGAA